jgi:hypothetical protein
MIKGRKLGWIFKLLAVSLAVSILVCRVIWKRESRETWPRLRQIDSSLSILNEPIQLMNLSSTFTGTNLTSRTEDIDATVETRHEALRALLNLQNRTFGIRTKPPSERGTCIDHICSWADLAATNVHLRLVTTPSRCADIHATEGAYWLMELLDFDENGRLVSRLAYNQPHDP